MNLRTFCCVKALAMLVSMVMPALGHILRCSAFRHVDVDVPPLEHLVIDADDLAVAFEVFQGEHGALLHHITQVACEGELAFALGDAGFDEEDVAAGRRQASPVTTPAHRCLGICRAHGWGRRSSR